MPEPAVHLRVAFLQERPQRANERPTPIDVHVRHLAMIERAAAAGRAWAHAALRPDGPLFYVAAGGFEDGFGDIAGRGDRPVVTLTLEDLFAAPFT